MPPAVSPRVPVGDPPSAEAPVPAAPRPLLGRRALVGLAVLLAAVGVAVFLVSRPPGKAAAPRPVLEQGYDEVDLGVFSRALPADVGGLLREEFVVRVILILNPDYGDPVRIRPLVERRRNLLRHLVNVKVIHDRPAAELRRERVFEDLEKDILHLLNGALGGLREGEFVIQKVLFPEATVSLRR